MKRKSLNERALELMLKHSRLIESKRRRGFSADVIVKEVLAREEKKSLR